jgi:Fe-S oxidoreductase
MVNFDLFITCFNDTLFPETGKATAAGLERLGQACTGRAASRSF